MFVFFGYYIDVSVIGGGEFLKEVGEIFYVFFVGFGIVLMNGCWGIDYKVIDFCYLVKWKLNVC